MAASLLLVLPWLGLGAALAFSSEQFLHGRWSEGQIQLIGWMALVFGGAFGVIGFAKLIQPDRLRVSPEGLVVESVLGARRVRWDEIGTFTIARLGGLEHVTYTLKVRPSSARASDGVLPRVGGYSAAHLCRVLTQWRRTYG